MRVASFDFGQNYSLPVLLGQLYLAKFGCQQKKLRDEGEPE